MRRFDHPSTLTPAPAPDDPIAWRTAPFDRHGLMIMAIAFLVGTSVSMLIGLSIVAWWDPGQLGEADADTVRWLVQGRDGGTIDELSRAASALSDTVTKVALGAVLAPLFLWWFRRWHEYTLIVGGLVLEVSIYGVSSIIVGRERPPVEQLDGAPTDSFPSGHIAAAVVFYVGLAIVIRWRAEQAWARDVAAPALALGVPALMVWSRLHLGMHYVTDAVASLALGAGVLVVMTRVVQRSDDPVAPPDLVARHPIGQGDR